MKNRFNIRSNILLISKENAEKLLKDLIKSLDELRNQLTPEENLLVDSHLKSIDENSELVKLFKKKYGLS